MVPRQQVIDYISSNVRSGYDIPSIRSRLIASGYEPGEISAAIDIVKSGKTSVSPRTSSGLFVMIGIAMVGFLLIAATALVLFKQPDVNVNPGVGTGDSFDKPDLPVNKPTKPNTDNVSTPNETSTTPKTPQKPKPPVDKPNLDFQGTIRDTIPSIEYDSDNTASPALMTRLAIENQVNQLASSKPDEAATLCGQINTLVGQQSCLNTVAQVSEQSRFCTYISDDDAADECLMRLAIKEVETVDLCLQIKGQLRFNHCVNNYDLQSQLDKVSRAAAEVQSHPLAPAPILPTEDQQVEYNTLSLDDALISAPAEDSQELNSVDQTDSGVQEDVPAQVDTAVTDAEPIVE